MMLIVMLMTPSTDTDKNCDNRDGEIEEDVEEEGGEGGEGKEEGEAEGVDEEVAQEEGEPDQESHGSATPALVVTGNWREVIFKWLQMAGDIWLMAMEMAIAMDDG